MFPTPRTTSELDQLISEPTSAVIDTVDRQSGRIAVLGAGGKMGFHLCLMLQKALRQLGRNDRVIAVSRFSNPSDKSRFAAAGFEVIAADLCQDNVVRSLPDWENIFFLAGVKFGTGDQPALLQQMNVQMPQYVAQHFRKSRIVAFSTGCVYSFTTPASGGSTENDETQPPGNYAKSCLGRETAFRDSASACGTRISLIRLNYSIDLRYGVLVDIARRVLDGQPVNVDMGYVNVIWQGDAIAHSIQSLAHASDAPFIINVTGPNVLRVRDIAESFAQRFHCQAVIEGTEQPTAWLSNAARSHQLFGRPQVSVDQMLDAIADWLQRGGETLNKPTHFEVRGGDY